METPQLSKLPRVPRCGTRKFRKRADKFIDSIPEFIKETNAIAEIIYKKETYRGI